MKNPSISVVVPAYNRPLELRELLESVASQSIPPREVVVCADFAPLQADIIATCRSSETMLSARGIKLVLIANSSNLGFDKNIRKAIESATSDWALIMGDDDLLLPDGIAATAERLRGESSADFYTRAFARFEGTPTEVQGVSRMAAEDSIFRPATHSSGSVFRSARFMSGLVVRADFARSISTERYDGLLYYQVYLAAVAFCRGGIGYISTPTVAGRTDNPPLFGSADDEIGVHIPGRYAAKARIKMWEGVLTIAQQVEDEEGVDLLSGIRRELSVRESFHVFEMNAGADRQELRELKSGLVSMGLYSHPLPKLLYSLDLLMGRRARPIYSAARRIIQR